MITFFKENKAAYVDQKILRPKDLEENEEINNQLCKIALECFYVSPQEFDLKYYPKAIIYILRDKASHVIVGFNMIAYGEVELDNQKHRILKIGPSAVLPEYRGHNFISLTTIKSVLKEYFSFKTDYLDMMLVAGNARFREMFDILPERYPVFSQNLLENYNKKMQAAAASVYPPTILSHLSDFSHNHMIGTNWIPRAKSDNSPPLPLGEFKGYATAHLIKINLRNFISALVYTSYKKLLQNLIDLRLAFVITAENILKSIITRIEEHLLGIIGHTSDDDVSEKVGKNMCYLRARL